MRVHRAVIDLIFFAYLSNRIAILRFEAIKFLHLLRLVRSLRAKRIEFHQFLFAHSDLVCTEIDMRNLPFAYKPVKSKTTDSKQSIRFCHLDIILLTTLSRSLFLSSSSCLRFHAVLEHLGEQYQDSMVLAINSSPHT